MATDLRILSTRLGLSLTPFTAPRLLISTHHHHHHPLSLLLLPHTTSTARMSFLPAKRRRGGEQPPHARLVGERHAGDVADLAQVGLLPEQVTLALASHQPIEDDAAPVLAGVDGRTARAYVLVGNTLYTWQLEPAELEKELEAPADRSLELLDRQGYPCITADTPAVAVLAPFGPRMPVAVVLKNGRLVWRELERGGAKSEYTAQLENGEEVTTAAWEMVGGDLAAGGGEAAGVQIMAFLGTTHGRVYRVGPLGGGGGGAGAGGPAISSGPMARPGGLTDYLPWRLRGPGPLESVRSLLVWEEGRGRNRTRRVMTLTGEGVHLYDASGAILAQIKILEQLRASCHDEAVSLVGATLLRPGVALLAAAVGLEEDEDAHLSLFLLDLRQGGGAGGERALAQAQAVPLLMEMDPPAGREGAPLTLDSLLQTRLEASRGNTATDIVAYLVHASSHQDHHHQQQQQQDDIVTVLHFRLAGAGQQIRARDLQRTDLVVPRAANTGSSAESNLAAAGGGLLGVGALLHTDTLALLAGPDKVLRVRALRHATGAAAAGTAAGEEAAAAGADEQRSRDVAGKVRRAFKLYMELQPAQAQAVVEAEGLLDLPDGLPELGAGLRRAIWQEVDLEPDTAPYWAGGGGGGGGGEGGQSAQEAFHLLIQHSLRRKLAVAERWLRFLSETGLWAKLTEAQGAALLEGAERVAACDQLCQALIPGGEEGRREMPAALAELLRAHAMPRWGEDLQDQVRARLDAAGLPPLDLFLANPSQVMRKLGSLQSARKEYMRRTGRPVSKKEQMEASLAITTVVWRSLDAAVRTRARLQIEHGVLRREAGRGGWLTEPTALHVMEREVERLRELVKEAVQPLSDAHCGVIGEKAMQLGTLWLEMGEMGGRWEGGEGGAKKRVAVLCVAEYGLIQEALAMARRARAWDVLGELEWVHRGWASGALVEDMGRHQEVASHVLNWLLDHAELEDVLEYGATSALARGELEKLFGSRPDVPGAARLAWMHHVHVAAFGHATEDLKSLAEGEKGLDLKKLWVDLGILSDEAARRHLCGQVAEEEARMALKEEQELLQAQSWLADLCRRGGRNGGAMKKLVEGLAIGPEETIAALIEWVPQEGLVKGQAAELALRAMDILDYYAGRRREVSREAAKEHVKALWAALIRRKEDWEGVWSNCGAMDPGRKVEATAYAAVVSEYMRPRGGEGERAEYPERLATPTEEVLRAAVRGLLATMKYKPQEAALITALERTRNTLWREE